MTSFRAFAMGSAALIAASAGVITIAQPASAVTCITSRYWTTAGDYARTTDVSGGCGQLGVRHHFSVPNTPVSQWTSWYYTSGDAVQTPVTRELDGHEHKP